MLNGSSPLQSSSSSGSGNRTRDARERESLNTSIRSSFAPRVPAGLGFDVEDAQPAPPDDATLREEGATHGALAIRYALLPFFNSNTIYGSSNSYTAEDRL